ncbi:hypothetical protein QJS04_geneDACA016054 [Acorus gramineus]|uniref:Phorbol-ester/DAG-type domain-containing protein n=1 Tax=Acorus gramineus TaxID=55184 RepID=A0AAV9BFB0_ACOGR|nr:hypothetical protein QJS04_geneDACA016054 [Acorus gramineus]
MKYGEITHFSHPQHKLRFEYSDHPFKCDGCKEAGIGSRFRCSFCDFDLHKHCGLLPSTTSTTTHPFYPKCAFQFLSKPPGDLPRFCNAKCGFDLHPCCMNLPHVLEAGDLKLYLYKKVGGACHRCGRKGRSWSYRSSCKNYNLHVACVTEMLVESWHEIYYGGGGNNSYSNSKKWVNQIPSIRGAAVNRHRHKKKGRLRKCCELAGLAVQFVISAVLGDPTTIIAGIVGSFISR